MPQYRLNGLGDQEFERMIQALLKEVIGSGTLTFGPGRDGGREATYSGEAPYPSQSYLRQLHIGNQRPALFGRRFRDHRHD